MTRKARRLPATSGLTLVEILVAVTLLSLLAVGMVTALQVGAESWSSARKALTFDRRIATANAILHSQLAGLVPVTAEPPRGVGLGSHPFFQGEAQAMRLVTSYSWTGGVRTGLRLVELLVSPGREGEGVRLLLTESPYRGPAMVGAFIRGSAPSARSGRPRLLFSAIRTRPDTLIVADRLARCRFLYLLAPENRDEPSLWLAEWDEARKIPAAIRVEMEPLDDDGRLQPVTLVAAVPARYVSDGERGAAMRDPFGRLLPYVDQTPAARTRDQLRR